MPGGCIAAGQGLDGLRPDDYHLAPNERALVTLRAYCNEGDTACSRSLMASLQNRVALGVVAQGANCARCTGAGCSTFAVDGR